ncbi:MAG: alpha/beta hydrolase [Betaproteobacteria bacterium]|nr:alpha/beta hydrolase [Betaproteobacteria bacterium]
MVAHDMGTAPSGELRIFYRRLGHPGRLPVLIVHGLSYFSYDWLPVAARLSSDREVACMDMRGFGDSGWSSTWDYSVPSMASDIVAVLDHLGWRRVALVGHSMGGRSSTYAAAKRPERVAGVALIDFSPENAPAGSKRVAQSVGNTPETFATIDDAMRYFGKMDRARFENYLRKTAEGYAVKRDPFFRDQFRAVLSGGERPKLGVDLWQLLGEVRCPLLSMRGARSDLYAAETKAKMQAANPRLRIVEVDAGHDIAGENPEGFLAALAPFLESLEEKSHEHARH